MPFMVTNAHALEGQRPAVEGASPDTPGSRQAHHKLSVFSVDSQKFAEVCNAYFRVITNFAVFEQFVKKPSNYVMLQKYAREHLPAYLPQVHRDS
jgi:hypothetical protein